MAALMDHRRISNDTPVGQVVEKLWDEAGDMETLAMRLITETGGTCPLCKDEGELGYTKTEFLFADDQITKERMTLQFRCSACNANIDLKVQ